MAIPIKDTPILTGKDAKRFLTKLEKEKDTKASAEEINRIKNNFKKLNSIAKF
jgi:hypothetical protein